MAEPHIVRVRRELRELNESMDRIERMLAPLIVRLAALEQQAALETKKEQEHWR